MPSTRFDRLRGRTREPNEMPDAPLPRVFVDEAAELDTTVIQQINEAVVSNIADAAIYGHSIALNPPFQRTTTMPNVNLEPGAVSYFGSDFMRLSEQAPIHINYDLLRGGTGLRALLRAYLFHLATPLTDRPDRADEFYERLREIQERAAPYFHLPANFRLSVSQDRCTVDTERNRSALHLACGITITDLPLPGENSYRPRRVEQIASPQPQRAYTPTIYDLVQDFHSRYFRDYRARPSTSSRAPQGTRNNGRSYDVPTWKRFPLLLDSGARRTGKTERLLKEMSKVFNDSLFIAPTTERAKQAMQRFAEVLTAQGLKAEVHATTLSVTSGDFTYKFMAFPDINGGMIHDWSRLVRDKALFIDDLQDCLAAFFHGGTVANVTWGLEDYSGEQT